jgi:hypothetical protein
MRTGERRFWRLSPPAGLLLAVMFFGAGFSFNSQGGHLIASTSSCQVLRADGSTSQPQPGSYVIVVRDTSRTRYFALNGPGVRRSTSSRFAGTRTWNVRLERGTYRFRCGAAKRLRGILSVG